jgi:hypothetical protein
MYVCNPYLEARTEKRLGILTKSADDLHPPQSRELPLPGRRSRNSSIPASARSEHDRYHNGNGDPGAQYDISILAIFVLNGH